MNEKRLLSISTDQNIFQEGSAVRARQIEYAKGLGQLHIIVFTKHLANSSSVQLSSNLWVYPTNSRYKWQYPFRAIKLGCNIIRQNKITDITCQDPFLTAMAGVALKKNFNIDLNIQVHTDIGSPNFAGHSLSNKIRLMLADKYIPQADTLRVVSQRIKDFIVAKFGFVESKIEVRPIKVDIETIKNAPVIQGADLHQKYSQFSKIVLMASRLESEKNIELAIHSWPIVLKSVPKAGLVIVGSGSCLAGLKTLVAKLDLNESVVFESWVDQPTLYSYYQTADLFLNTSLYEGYGMTLVEASSAGCKVVSTDVGVAREVGAVVVGWSEEEVAEGIISALS